MGGGKEAVKEIEYDEALCRDRRSEWNFAPWRDISSRVWSLDVNEREASGRTGKDFSLSFRFHLLMENKLDAIK